MLHLYVHVRTQNEININDTLIIFTDNSLDCTKHYNYKIVGIFLIISGLLILGSNIMFFVLF